MGERDGLPVVGEQFDIDESQVNLITTAKDVESGIIATPRPTLASSLMLAIMSNIVSTVAIVFINKSIFASPHFNNAQFIFASYHFFIIYLVLSLVSSPRPWLAGVKQFERRQVPTLSILPLAASMSLSVLFLNTSLAFCSVMFYQTVRVLLTPMVAIFNYFLFAKTIPRQAALMLVPTCAGVAFMAYNDTKNSDKSNDQSTSLFGAVFALTGVVISSVYTVWVSAYHRKLDMSSTQLLHAQSLLGGVMLGTVGVLSGKMPDVYAFEQHVWLMVILSGLCAVVLNVTQFRIIAEAGPVPGTVVGHAKTILIVLIGWSTSGKAVNDGSLIGIIIAIAGIIAYTVAERHFG